MKSPKVMSSRMPVVMRMPIVMRIPVIIMVMRMPVIITAMRIPVAMRKLFYMYIKKNGRKICF